ncbi:hypothetical protein HG535_0B00220 [Zygotorulaspora mrakii]|uniref:N-acetyltransferase domain-containing protein n=1 Tax=Zygotorulaspora mrakii TaxID=42260 RepID=A0A7H9AX84_ZYGMR|nr:uncharacterized protein HG535_0B00220 [Zygotorulaspora mrakii]QLG70985.1 hypothetical protein HG535_0B00220 [Zygotorulaspora mrakii]
MPDSIIIRQVQEGDQREWERLWKLFQIFHNVTPTDELSKANFQRFLDPQIKMWAALAIDLETGKALGMVNYFSHITTWATKDKILLNDLYVDETARVRGLGRQLVQYVYDEADKMNTPHVYWCTDYFNHRAQILYTKVGYQTSRVIYRRTGH